MDVNKFLYNTYNINIIGQYCQLKYTLLRYQFIARGKKIIVIRSKPGTWDLIVPNAKPRNLVASTI